MQDEDKPAVVRNYEKPSVRMVAVETEEQVMACGKVVAPICGFTELNKS